MAVSKTIRRRDVDGSLVDLYPKTYVANLFKEVDGVEAISTTAQKILKMDSPTGIEKFLRVDMNGDVVPTFSPEDFDSIASVHTHSMDDVIMDDEVPLSTFLADNVNGLVPLGDGNVIAEQYWPDAVIGHMKYVGTFNPGTDGQTTGTAINVSTIFTNYSVNPTQKIGQYYIFTAGCYIKSDGVTNSGTELIDAEVEGPVWVNTGDRIVYAEYSIDESLVSHYKFIPLKTLRNLATTTTSGIVKAADHTMISDRGTLSNAGTSALRAVSEAVVRNAMRDIVYYPDLKTIPIPQTNIDNAHIFYQTVTGEPTHTSGTVQTSTPLYDALLESHDGQYVMFSSGKLYQISEVGANISHTYIGTYSVPTGITVGSYVHGAQDTNIYVVIANVFGPAGYGQTYIPSTLVEGDILIS